MTYRRNIWGPLASDDIGANVGAPFPAVSILITDSHPPFQFDTLVQTSTTSASTTPIHVGIGFVDEPLAFIDATSAPASPGGAQTSSLTFDELSSLYPRIAWPSLSDQIASMIGEILSQNPLLHDVVERAGPVFDISSLFSGIEWPPLFGQSAAPTDGIVALDTPSQGDAGTGLIQDTGPAGLDWRITPDFDDDPGWHPGVIFPPTSTTDNGDSRPDTPAGIDAMQDTDPPSGDRADLPPAALQDEERALTYDEVSAQYPGIVWPANWWVL